MNTSKTNKRARLIETGLELVYRKGFNRSSLADIAREAEVPLGNVYYYFKTKESLGEAVVEERSRMYREQRVGWSVKSDPRARLKDFVGMTMDNRDSLAESGCPIGTLLGELQKDGGQLARSASGLFQEILDWLEIQFQELGQGQESRELAEYLLSLMEGASLLTHSFGDPGYVERRMKRLNHWIDTITTN